MSAPVYLLVKGKLIENFVSYRIDADLYQAADAFEFECAGPSAIAPGDLFELYVNDILEMTGLVDRVTTSYGREGRKTLIAGRDLMGLLSDSHCTEFPDLQGMTLRTLAERLLNNVDFIKREQVKYQEDAGSAVGRTKQAVSAVAIFDPVMPGSRIEPGKSVFEALRDYAKSCGLFFWAMPDGTFVFGRPREAGVEAFHLVHRRDGRGNNALSGELTDDLSKRYSHVTVVGQKQDTTGLADPNAVNIEAEKPDDSFPFYKPFVLRDEFGGDRPELQARLALEKMRHDGFRLAYRVAGHDQRGRNWAINELVHVTDEDFGIDRTYLLFGRTFEKTKDGGTCTLLRLGYPGMIA